MLRRKEKTLGFNINEGKTKYIILSRQRHRARHSGVNWYKFMRLEKYFGIIMNRNADNIYKKNNLECSTYSYVYSPFKKLADINYKKNPI